MLKSLLGSEIVGYGMEYVCPNCGYDVSYFLGFGKLYLDFKMTCEILFDLDNLINKEDLDKILSSESFIHESDKDNYEKTLLGSYAEEKTTYQHVRYLKK